MGDQQEIVFPGDPVAIAEEFLPGPGTYEEEGEVKAAAIGVLELDPDEFVARVKTFTPDVATVRVGDVVIGEVRMTRESMAIVEVKALANRPNRAVAGDTNGTLAIRNVADHYVSRMEDEFRLSDLVRAEVTQVEPSIQLSTKGPVYGVLKRYCPRCRLPMPKKGDGLECAECGWKDSGHLAPDYGEGKLAWEGPIPEETRKPRDRGGRGGGGRGGDRRGGRGGGDRRGGDRRGGDRRGGGRGREGGRGGDRRGGRGGGGRGRRNGSD